MAKMGAGVKIQRVAAPKCLLGEGPIWDLEEQALYFVDILGKVVHRFHPQRGATRTWNVGKVIGSMALRAQGGAVIALFAGARRSSPSSRVARSSASSRRP